MESHTITAQMNEEKSSKLSAHFPKNIRKDFPALEQKIDGHPLVYLDNAATTLKPKCVVDRLFHFYLYAASNIHRGAHTLSDKATEEFEKAREKVRNFIGAKDEAEIIFTKGTTESINLVAHSYVRAFLKPGEEIILTEMEHHSNIVPWQLVAQEKKLTIKVIPVTDEGELNFEAFQSLLNEKTRFVSISWVSNVLGTVNPIKDYIQASHKVGAKVFIDAAQSVGFLKTDVQDLDCDFLSFSGHKIFGPFGVGVLYGKKNDLESMPPYQSGGATIETVSFKKTYFLPPPHRFEAGTPPIAEVIALGVALDYVSSLGFHQIYEHKKSLISKANHSLKDIPHFSYVGTSPTRVSLFSFILKDIHSSDVGNLLNQSGVAVRTGHHCAEPLMKRYQLSSGTVRVSFSIYNTEKDIELLREALLKARSFFS